MTKQRLFTGPQKSALLALYCAGGRVLNAGKLAKSFESLCLYHPDLAISEYGDFGPRGGRKRRIRLTDTGRDVVAEIQAVEVKA